MQMHGWKLEISGTLEGQWARRGLSPGTGGFPVRVVSQCGPNRCRPRGVIATPVSKIREGRWQPRVFGSQGAHLLSRVAHKPGQDAVRNREKHKTEAKESSTAPRQSSAEETGGEGEDKEQEQLNADNDKRRALIQPERAFSHDSKTCNTNPHPNADGGHGGNEGLLKAEDEAYFF